MLIFFSVSMTFFPRPFCDSQEIGLLSFFWLRSKKEQINKITHFLKVFFQLISLIFWTESNDAILLER